MACLHLSSLPTSSSKCSLPPMWSSSKNISCTPFSPPLPNAQTHKISMVIHRQDRAFLSGRGVIRCDLSWVARISGVPTMLGKRSMSFPGLEVCEDMVVHGEEELSDDGLQVGEKKRRLNMEQVRTLEKNFELGNKLEPERKMQLARALGLQPRQIAIWFQNRRARWKTKQLEKDYDALKKQFEDAKLENDELHALNRKLQSELIALKGSLGRETPEPINLNKDTDQLSSSNRSDNSSTINLEITRTPPPPQDAENPLNLNSQRPFFQQFLQDATATRSSDHHINSRPVQDESFCNMLCALDDQSGFWNVWPDHQGFH